MDNSNNLSYSMTCTCPENGRTIISTERVYVYEPDAEVRQGHTVVRNAEKVHIFHKDCPKHGYKEINIE